MTGGVAAAVISGVLTWGAQLQDQFHAEQVDCAVAYERVHDALVNDVPDGYLDKLNSDKVDAQCGKETVIASEMLKINPGLRHRAR